MVDSSSTSVERGMESLSFSTAPKNIEVVTFAVSVPDANDGIEIGTGMNAAEKEKNTVVGTITFMNKSAVIWIGWGEVETDDEIPPHVENSHTVGTGTPVMGSLVVAMPRSRNNETTPCSQLISGPNDEEMMVGWQMASRLSKKTGWPIFVSCSLGSNVTGLESGWDEGVLLQRAAAYSEREVGKILIERKALIEKSEG